MTSYISIAPTGDSVVFTDTSGLTLPTTQTTSTIIGTSSGSSIKISRRQGVAPKLYFLFVKSKLTPIEVGALKKRTKNLFLLLESAQECGQQGLSESLEKQIYVLLRYEEAAACGYGRFVLADHIHKFRSQVRDNTVGFCRLENFPRPINIKTKGEIRKVRDKQIFDEYWVLYNDPTKTPIEKTTKEKIKEKDPILFGKFSYDDDRFFYITDWKDEHCDLTMDKFVDELRKEKTMEEYSLGIFPELDRATVEEIKRKVISRETNVSETNRGNWKDKEEIARLQEELDKLKKKQAKPGFLGWLRSLFTFDDYLT